MRYISIDYCFINLFDLAIAYDETEETPHYSYNRDGIDRLEGVLEKVTWDHYDDFHKKAAFLFISINKGHFFSNGNKRLALVVLLDFCYLNRYVHVSIPEESYRNWFAKEFPKYHLTENKFKRVYAWGFYHLNKAVASSELHDFTFDQLKEKVGLFLS